ncbi:hypothetical protein C5167_017621 [Papaver somniferum]|uniref:Uncharacterized protein n=1 Tax=Papaver somniferum TaxID=3469 RepID=A0A4Y7IP12_PAPSO|nr:hypothetical protein C5167_017621 [Papaver somniferum]
MSCEAESTPVDAEKPIYMYSFINGVRFGYIRDQASYIYPNMIIIDVIKIKTLNSIKLHTNYPS